MHFQFEVAPPRATSVPDSPPNAPPAETNDLLRQMLELQREQVQLLRFVASAHDASSRWKAFLSRWKGDFPDVGQHCRAVLPTIEKAYIGLISELTELLDRAEEEPLDNEFALNEFLDRYGIRLGQLGTILSLISPLAEAARAEE